MPGWVVMRGQQLRRATFLLLAATAAASCTPGTQAQGTTPPAQTGGRGGAGAAVPIAVGTVVKKSMPLDLSLIGTVEPSSTVSIHAQMTGQLTSIGFKEGDDVSAGATVFTLD